MATPDQRTSKPSLREWLEKEDWNLRSGVGQLARRVSKIVSAEIKSVVGIDSFLPTEDRRVLEKVIFPYFVDSDAYRSVLFIGCSWCTRPYNRLFERSKTYWSIDYSPWKRRYGGRQHVTDGLQNLRQHFEPETFDFIICNGVYGWGLNERDDVEAAFSACAECLTEDGILLIGWGDREETNPCPFGTLESLRALRPFVFPPLQTAQYLTDTPYRQTYSFYRRPRAGELMPPGQTQVA